VAKNWASPTSQSTHSPEWLPSHHSLQVAIQISSGGTRCLAGSASEARATHRYNCEDSAAVSARTPRPRRKKPAIKKYSGGCTLFVECRCLTLAVHKTVRYHLKAKLKQPRTCYGHLTGANSVRAPFPPEKNPSSRGGFQKNAGDIMQFYLSEPQQHQYGGGFVSGVPMRVG
jgi:hypothetical protein